MLCMIVSMVDSPEDKRKVEKLYEKYNGLMFAVAGKILTSKEDIEDAVLHSWEKIIKNIDKINKIDCKETKSFIVILTERVSIDHYRKLKREKTLSLDEYEESPYLFTTDREIEKYETIEWFRTIPKRYCEVLIMFYVNGLSTKEIAKVLGIKEGSVSSRLSRAREIIKKQLEEK